MSAFDYSKFDKIVDSDSDENDDPEQLKDEQREMAAAQAAAGNPTVAQEGGVNLVPSISSDRKPVPMTKKGTEKGRYKFEYQGRTVYEWEQNLEEVNIYLHPPPGMPRHMIVIDIAHKHLTVGIKGHNQSFIDEDTWGPVKPEESMWTMVDGEININLQKMNKAETWEAALMGRDGAEVDPVTKEEIRKKMMLDRFQEEHPGFDFSGADFNGDVPEARDFLGGVKRSF
jgi:hypothetical protein